MDCIIEYHGKILQVTPDTAADLVHRGEARLIEGELGDLPVEGEPEPVKSAKPKAAKAKR